MEGLKGEGHGSCGCSSVVEHELPKLAARVRFPSPAPSRMGIEARERRAKRGKGLWPPASGLATQASSASRSSRFPSPAPGFIFILILSISGCATPPHAIPVADVRSIGGVSHTVRSGETLWRISKIYGVDVDALIKANSIEDTTNIKKGQVLFIPGIRTKREDVNYSVVRDSFAWPVNGTVICFFGTRIDKIKNKGIDIRAERGGNVRASRAGKVVFYDENLKGFGKTIILDHGDNYQTVYAYNSDIVVKLGDKVEQGELIARAGRTGRAKEPGLHFEIRRNGEPRNPLYYLPHK